MCFCILTCAFQSGGLQTSGRGSKMAVFNRREMCVLWGMEANAAAL